MTVVERDGVENEAIVHLIFLAKTLMMLMIMIKGPIRYKIEMMMKQGMNGLTLPSHCQHCSPAASASKSFVSVGTWVQPD